jgi:antirestriction protein ArdC
MDVYRVIAERIIEKLEQGTVPWHKSWQSMGAPNSCFLDGCVARRRDVG